MKLRTKLLLGYAGFVLALGVLGAWSARTLSQMSAVSGRIIAENYDSVVAAQDMKESLERQDSAALFDLLGQRDRARRQVAEHRARFDAAFDEGGGEHHGGRRARGHRAIRRGRDEYYRRFDAFLDASGDRTRALLSNRSSRSSTRCEPMRSAAAPESGGDAPQGRRRLAHRAALVLRHAGAGPRAHGGRHRRRGEPVQRDPRPGPPADRRDHAARRRRSRQRRSPVRSADEIGTLAVGFNRMAERIRELRRSDLGKLLVAQQTTEAAIDSLYDPVLVTDSDRRVTRINPAAERLFGARADVIGQPIDEITRDSRIAQAVTDVLQSGSTVASESPAAVLPWAVDGARRAFRVRSTPMRDADGRLVGAVTLLEDITHLTEISRLKSEFIADASHELRTPLTSVQMGIHLLLEDASSTLTERQKDILQVCREDTGAARSPDAGTARSVEDRIGRRDAGARRRCARRRSCATRSTRSGCRSKRSGSAWTSMPRRIFRTCSSIARQIERVIGNLVTNAARATPAGGTHHGVRGGAPRTRSRSRSPTPASGFRATTSRRSSSRSCRCRTRRAAAPGSA